MQRFARTTRCRPSERIAQVDEEGVAQAAQNADFTQHSLGLIGTAEHVRDALQRNLHISQFFKLWKLRDRHRSRPRGPASCSANLFACVAVNA